MPYPTGRRCNGQGWEPTGVTCRFRTGFGPCRGRVSSRRRLPGLLRRGQVRTDLEQWREPGALIETGALEAALGEPNLRIVDCTTWLRPSDPGDDAPYRVRPGSPRFGRLKPEEEFTYPTVQSSGSISGRQGSAVYFGGGDGREPNARLRHLVSRHCLQPQPGEGRGRGRRSA